LRILAWTGFLVSLKMMRTRNATMMKMMAYFAKVCSTVDTAGAKVSVPKVLLPMLRGKCMVNPLGGMVTFPHGLIPR